MKKIEQCEPEGVVTLLRKIRYWTVCLIFIFGLLMSLNLSAGISENAPAITDNLKISTGFAADTIVRGRVVGTQKEPLSGVSIKLEGTSDASGTLTNADGQYSITVREGDKVLIFSYVGYLSQRVAIGDQVSVNVVLQKGDQQMEEVVVVGYGTKKRADLTGAVVTIGNKELKQTPTLNISNSLVGRLPGVIANNRSGEPGNDGSSILIRGMSTLGDNAPLIVIDGVADRGSLDRLDPNEIESISVLKDASAAIYGSRAANGVILVTTKRGKMGKPRVAYDFGHAWVTRTRTPIQNNAYEYALAYNEMFKNDGLAPFYSEEDIQKYKDGSDPVTHPNTNWAKEVFKKHANQDRHSLTVNGGTERIRYFVSLGYQAQD
ncbi:MAG TPA: SusC/RagA family TonB-linked outer membrane protein, partial [Chitinophagaceae bacterium]|nr:SusC/RagA family TonB-linked outer membrane protein [Chitinophagaceae bacterium]